MLCYDMLCYVDMQYWKTLFDRYQKHITHLGNIAADCVRYELQTERDYQHLTSLPEYILVSKFEQVFLDVK